MGTCQVYVNKPAHGYLRGYSRNLRKTSWKMREFGIETNVREGNIIVGHLLCEIKAPVSLIFSAHLMESI